MASDHGRGLLAHAGQAPPERNPRPIWVTLPWSRSPRWYVPRNPGIITRRSFLIYHPVTLRSRLGWEAARSLAARGAFRLLRGSAMVPREVWDPVAPLIPHGGALAIARANHPGRFLALVVGDQGELRVFVKIARDSVGSEALDKERWALESLGPMLPPPLFAPKVLDHQEGVLVLEPVEWRIRDRPWRLPPEVAHALGAFFRSTSSDSGSSLGAWHGDCTPWNLLRTESGWALVDWENAENEKPPFFDVFHFLVQASVELRRPMKRSIVWGLAGEGWVGASIEAYAHGCQVDPSEARSLFSDYLRDSVLALEPSTPGRAVRMRRRLARMERRGGTEVDGHRGSRPAGGPEPEPEPGRSSETGLFVLIVGPDGSGKSSLATRLVEAARRDGRPVRHMHWRPGILPQAGTLGGTSPDPSRPHGRKVYGRLLSLLRVYYYWIDFFIGLRLRVLPVRSRGGLAVMERGWWDFAVDPLRYRLRVRPGLVERLGRLLPRPDLVIILEAAPEVLVERKRELPPGELGRQIARWRQIGFPKGVVPVVIDAARRLDEVAIEADRHVGNMLMSRVSDGRGTIETT